MQMATNSRSIGSSKAAIDMITQFTEAQGNMIVRAWRDLLPQLITKFHDGMFFLHLLLFALRICGDFINRQVYISAFIFFIN
jgi:hypothetical protein